MRTLSEILMPVLASVLAIGSATCNEGCHQELSREQKYVLDINACSAVAKTKAEAVACRRAVNEQYGLCDTWPKVSPCDE